MAEQKTLAFPYEFKDITPEEEEILNKVYKLFFTRYLRVGPKGYLVPEPFIKHAAGVYNMPLRPSDVFVASYQRSGTTLTQELVWLLGNDLDYSKAAEIPLTIRYAFLEISMMFDENKLEYHLKTMRGDDTSKDEILIKGLRSFAEPATEILGAMPETTRRFIKTHLPMSLINPNVLETAKVVYVARDPRDVAVSCFHHANLFKMAAVKCDFKGFWKLFLKNLYMLQPLFEHVKEAWELRHHPNMLFIFYEDLTKNMSATIRRVADFLDKEINKEQLDDLLNHLKFENFKNNASVNFEETRELGWLSEGESFIRKGKSGGWREYFDEEMTIEAERWIADNLRDTDLRYPHITPLS